MSKQILFLSALAVLLLGQNLVADQHNLSPKDAMGNQLLNVRVKGNMADGTSIPNTITNRPNNTTPIKTVPNPSNNTTPKLNTTIPNTPTPIDPNTRPTLLSIYAYWASIAAARFNINQNDPYRIYIFNQNIKRINQHNMNP
jgi:hypothetical protein